MKITFEEAGEEITFRISDFAPRYESVLQACYYQQEENSYYKKFPQNAKYMPRIKEHFRKHAREMFDQAGYFNPVPWREALLAFIQPMEAAGIDWWLTGSCATCLRGVPLQPHDVDIIVDSRDLDFVCDIFADWIIEPFIDTQGWVVKDFGVLFLHARVDVASDPQPELDVPEPSDCGPFARDHLESLIWEGHRVKVPPLSLQLNVNRRRNRLDRVKRIEAHLQKSPSFDDDL